MFGFTRAVLGAVLPLAGLLAWPPSAVAQGPLDGDWELAVTMPQGPNTVDLSLKQEGDKVAGMLKTPLGSLPVAGTFEGGVIKLAASVKFQDNGVDLGLNGKLEGEALSGTVKLGDFGEFPFVGKRGVKAAAAAPAAASAPASSPADLTSATGTWDLSLSLGGAQVPATAVLKQDGDQVTGVLKTPLGETPVKGTMSGKALKLEFSATTPQGAIPITLTGNLDEKGFAGKMSVTGLGEADWTGTRTAR